MNHVAWIACALSLGASTTAWGASPFRLLRSSPTGAAVEVTAARAVRFERCTVSNTGAYGIGLGMGCQGCEVAGCLMSDLGGGGVKVGDPAMAQQAAPSVSSR